MPRTEDRDNASIQAVDRCFDIIETLSENRGLRLTELASAVDLPTSTVHGYLGTLQKRGYVSKDGSKYRLGLRFLEQGGSIRHSNDIYALARHPLDSLAFKTDQVTALGVEQGGRRVLLYIGEGNGAVYDNAPTGEFTHMHWSALGKAILSQYTETRIRDIVERHGLPQRTNQTITDTDELLDHLAATHERGYSIEDEERRPGIRSMAVPITDEHGDVVASISISGPKNRLDDTWIQDVGVPLLNETANVIELQYIHE